MRFRSLEYPILSLYEILRSISLVRAGAVVGGQPLPITWYAGIPLLCVMPIIFALLAADEAKNAPILGVAALIKSLGVLSLAAFAASEFPNAIRFSAAGDFTAILILSVSVLFGVADLVVALLCIKKARKLCK